MSRKPAKSKPASHGDGATLERLAAIPPWEWPEEARDVLLKVMSDPGALDDQRIVAGRLAGDVTVLDDELADAMLTILLDGTASEPLRSSMAISFGPILEDADTYGFDDPEDLPVGEPTVRRIQQVMRQLFEDKEQPRKLRRRVLEAAIRAPAEWQREPVRAAHDSGEADWKLTAVFCMRYIGGFDKEILRALDDSDEEIRTEAINAAGNWELDEAWDKIAPLVSAASAPRAARLAAIGAVAAIRPQQGAELLSGLLDSDDEEVVEAVSEALALAAATDDDEDPDQGT